MLPSPAAQRRTSKNVGPGPQLMSCEAQRDLVSARAREPLNQRNRLRTASATPPNRHFETLMIGRSCGSAPRRSERT
jgi:hypothetical protein